MSAETTFGGWALQNRLMGQSLALVSPKIPLLVAQRKDREAAPVRNMEVRKN